MADSLYNQPGSNNPGQGKSPQPKNNIKKSKQKKPAEPKVPSEVTKAIDSIMRRLRLLEERYSGLRKKSQFTEQNMLRDTKEISEDISSLNDSLSELKNEVIELSEKMEKLFEEVRSSAGKHELNVLSKYLDFWQPMDFLTRKEAEELIKEIKENKEKD